jgi:hypothetical protein
MLKPNIKNWSNLRHLNLYVLLPTFIPICYINFSKVLKHKLNLQILACMNLTILVHSNVKNYENLTQLLSNTITHSKLLEIILTWNKDIWCSWVGWETRLWPYKHNIQWTIKISIVKHQNLICLHSILTIESWKFTWDKTTCILIALWNDWEMRPWWSYEWN